MASKKVRIVVVASAVVVLTGVVLVNATRDRRSRIQVQTGKVGRADLVSVVSAQGEVKPKRFVNISANVPGRITHLYVKEGERVRNGQVLCRIDSTRFEAGTRQGEAALQAAKADLERAVADLDVSRIGFERTKKMYEDKVVSDQAFDQAQAEIRMKTASVEALKRRIAQQEAALETNRDDLEKTTVIAPMDGVVTALVKEEGEMVIGAQSFSPTVIMTVADLSVMEAEVMVDETDIRKVALGQGAEVRLDALENVKIKGEVTEIGSSAVVRGASGAAAGTQTATAVNAAKDFKVTITLKDLPPALRSGLNATADITVAKKDKVTAVPVQAVVMREIGKDGKVIEPGAVQAASSEPSPPPSKKDKGEEKEGVFVVVNGTAGFRSVKTGIMGETEIEVTEGLKEGEEIVTGSYRTLRTLKDQARIKIQKPGKGEGKKS